MCVISVFWLFEGLLFSIKIELFEKNTCMLGLKLIIWNEIIVQQVFHLMKIKRVQNNLNIGKFGHFV